MVPSDDLQGPVHDKGIVDRHRQVISTGGLGEVGLDLEIYLKWLRRVLLTFERAVTPEHTNASQLDPVGHLGLPGSQSLALVEGLGRELTSFTAGLRLRRRLRGRFGAGGPD